MNVCDSCKAGYLLNAVDGVTCDACSVGNCDDCAGNTSECQTCASGHTLVDAYTCTVFPTNCVTVAADNTCDECNTGFYGDTTTSCTPCNASDCADCSANN